MKRKKWTEQEEVTLMSAYSELISPTAAPISRLKTRQKRFQPIADRVNAHHHHRDAAAFPFLWSWRDVSVKIQNMRHQYLGVKHKILSSSPSSSTPQFHWDLAHHHWPNFLRYKQVFGDVEFSPLHDDADDDQEDLGGSRLGLGFRKRRGLSVARKLVEVDELGLRREERRREEDYEERIRVEVEEERERSRRRREERREEEEMEWMERMMRMQMEHEKQVLQMHADACQTQLQVVGVLARVVCQLFGPVGGGDGVFSQQVLHNLQNQQDQGSMGADNGKSDTSSPGQYL